MTRTTKTPKTPAAKSAKRPAITKTTTIPPLPQGAAWAALTPVQRMEAVRDNLRAEGHIKGAERAEVCVANMRAELAPKPTAAQIEHQRRAEADHDVVLETMEALCDDPGDLLASTLLSVSSDLDVLWHAFSETRTVLPADGMRRFLDGIRKRIALAITIDSYDRRSAKLAAQGADHAA